MDIAETAARMRAAMAYANMNQQEAAGVLDVSVAQLARMLGKKGNELRAPTWEQRWAFAMACGLPREWFSADLERLDEIVPAGAPVFARASASAGAGADETRGTAAKSPRVTPRRARMTPGPSTPQTSPGDRSGSAKKRAGDRRKRS